jgi:tRNA threonylcarbamoyladenosine biosynthesis protein TsaB
VTTHWLAIDTATDLASVAVSTPDRTVAQSIRGARQHAAQIVPLIHEVLSTAHLSLEQIRGIVVGDGPGSFTGLRIGWAAAKGLIQQRPVPMLAIPSLLGAAHAAGVNAVAACYDALRGQVFGGIYVFATDGMETLVAPELFTIAELAAAFPRTPDLAVGDGAERYRAEVLAWTGKEPLGLDALPPVAASLLTLARYAGAGRPLGDAGVAEPVYGRPPRRR